MSVSCCYSQLHVSVWPWLHVYCATKVLAIHFWNASWVISRNPNLPWLLIKLFETKVLKNMCELFGRTWNQWCQRFPDRGDGRRDSRRENDSLKRQLWWDVTWKKEKCWKRENKKVKKESGTRNKLKLDIYGAICKSSYHTNIVLRILSAESGCFLHPPFF